MNARLYFVLFTLFLILSGCKSVKKDDFYVNRTTGDKVRVVFVGNEKDMIDHYGSSLKYQSAPEGTGYVMFEHIPLASEAVTNEAKILTEKEFLKDYGWAEKGAP